MLKVLLISPLPGIDPACGDVTYTQALMDSPPEGVKYISYRDALEDGTLIEHAKRDRLRREPIRTMAAKAINVARRTGKLLFWEPFRFFSIRPGVYDLIHVHVFSCAFLKHDCPIVVSNAAPLRSLYVDARGWSRARVRCVEWIERLLAKVLGVNHTSYRLPQADRVMAFTEFLKKWYIARGIKAAEDIDIVPIYLSLPQVGSGDHIPQKSVARIGFIAKDFDAKGGEILLKAFVEIRKSRLDVELMIVGCPPRMNDHEAAERCIIWTPYVPRDRLLQEILPSFDVLAYPTCFDGQPLVVIEALAAGVPVATSDYQAMPEMVNYGKAGLVSPVGDVARLAFNILKLLDPELNEQYRRDAHDWFKTKFSADVVRPMLGACYKKAVGKRDESGTATSAEVLDVSRV